LRILLNLSRDRPSQFFQRWLVKPVLDSKYRQLASCLSKVDKALGKCLMLVGQHIRTMHLSIRVRTTSRNTITAEAVRGNHLKVDY
jgi:hypothetical protein